MRRALLLCLVLVACRNETDERLRKLEKEVADMKANPAVETIAVPVPTATAPVPPAEDPIPRTLTLLETEKLLGPQAAFVSTPTQQNLGFYCVFNRQIVLYKWDETAKVYRQIGIMADYRRLNIPIDFRPELIQEMRDFITRSAEKP